MPRHAKKVHDNPAASRAHGKTDADGDIYISPRLSDHARRRARARRPFTQREIDIWRARIFGETCNDPVAVVVQDAVTRFGRANDFAIWAWYANRIGVNNFFELVCEQQSIMREHRLHNPAGAFHARLRRFYNEVFARAKGGAA